VPIDARAARVLFIEHLSVIDEVVRFACRRGGLPYDDFDDFASHVKVALIEDDYAVIRKFENRSSFPAFASIVVQRMLLDYRITQWGKWHASTEARRLGDQAVTIEAAIVRDRQSVDEALPALRRRWPELTRESVENLLARLPRRQPRARAVDLSEAEESAAEAVNELDFESAAQSRTVAEIVRCTIRELDERKGVIFRLHFEGGLSVAQIARTLAIDQKPLYRDIQRCLAELRRRLEDAGISAADLRGILSCRADLDFGFQRTDDAAVADEETT
jgi:RNA polymerase sigma factor for flagellar operon FliA